MLTGALMNFFMESITFIPDKKLGEHYLIARDVQDFIYLYTHLPSEFHHELAKGHLLNHWKQMRKKSTHWSALKQVCYDNYSTQIEIEHVTNTDARIRHYNSLNRKADGREILKFVENWLKLISSVTKLIKSLMLQLPEQAVSSNDCDVFVCAYIEYAS